MHQQKSSFLEFHLMTLTFICIKYDDWEVTDESAIKTLSFVCGNSTQMQNHIIIINIIF